MFKSSVGDVGMPGHEDLSCVAGHSLLLMPLRATRLKAESQKPQEMRFRCIMAGFDPDAPGEMQEFLRVQALQLWLQRDTVEESRKPRGVHVRVADRRLTSGGFRSYLVH